MRSSGWFRALVAGLVVLTVAVQPAAADDSSATLKLTLKAGSSMRYALRGELHQEQTNTYSDDSTQTASSNQTFEQVVRYEIGAPIDANSSEATVVLESFTLTKDDEAPVTRTNVAEARARLLSTGALRDIKVVGGNAPDLDRLGIGAFAFEYPGEPMMLNMTVDRPFPILLFVTWHSERISAHSDTKLASVSPGSVAVVQNVDFHEANVPLTQGVVASADVTGTASHTIDRTDGWPRGGTAEGRLETVIDASDSQADSPSDNPVPINTAGSISLVQSYERRQ